MIIFQWSDQGQQKITFGVMISDKSKNERYDLVYFYDDILFCRHSKL